jgi:chemotaxis protein MotB
MARKHKAAHGGNHERWLVSYADFMTLLFAFFTSMYAISTVDSQKAGKMVFSTRAAFNLDFFPSDKPVLGSGGGQAQDVVKGPEKVVAAMERPFAFRPRDKPRGRYNPQRMLALADDLQRYIDDTGLGSKVRVRMTMRGLILSMAAAALFDSGSSEVRRESLPMLDIVATKVLASGHPIMIEGHTDDRALRSVSYRSNWELSTARATRVLSYLVEEFAYPPEMLAAAGYASYHPVAANDTAEGRAENRRVDLVVLSGNDPANKAKE